MKWAVGLITCPRQQGYYLDRTLQSLNQAGWSDVVIYAEPGSEIPPSFHGTVVQRRKQYGDWTNWASGLYDLFLSKPDTDYFFMAEDDFVVFSQAKEYLERTLPSLEPFASVSLYTPSIYQSKSRGFHDESAVDIWSTVTVIMSQRSVQAFFSDEDVQRHRFTGIADVNPSNRHASYGRGFTSLVDTTGNTVKDVVIGRWARRHNLPVYFHTPALAEHIGIYSTLTDDVSTAENGRMTNTFIGEDAVVDWLHEPMRIVKSARLY